MPASLVSEVNGAASKMTNSIVTKGTTEGKLDRETCSENINCGQFRRALQRKQFYNID